MHRILPQLGLTTGLAIVVTFNRGVVFGYKVGLTAIPFTLLGITLAIFIGFRNSVSYERYWEARKLWGDMLNHSRSAARQVRGLAIHDQGEGDQFILGLVAFMFAARHQLRGMGPGNEVKAYLSSVSWGRVQHARFPPAMILLLLGEQLGRWTMDPDRSFVLTQAIDRSLSGLTEAIGGCERIAATPIPFPYSVLVNRTIYIYSFLLPFGLIDSIGPMTPVIVALMSYTFFALEALAEEIEDPFGTEPNDLALDAICRTAEIALLEMLGRRNLPEPAIALRYVLR